MKYLVSACLAGFPCRYDGSAKPDAKIQRMYENGEVLPLCPEKLSGLPIPRPPCEQKNGRVVNRLGEDITDKICAGAKAAFNQAMASGCRKAILKARSPSCGIGEIYDGTFSGNLTCGNGVFAQMLIDAGFTVATEENWAEQDN